MSTECNYYCRWFGASEGVHIGRKVGARELFLLNRPCVISSQVQRILLQKKRSVHIIFFSVLMWCFLGICFCCCFISFRVAQNDLLANSLPVVLSSLFIFWRYCVAFCFILTRHFGSQTVGSPCCRLHVLICALMVDECCCSYIVQQSWPVPPDLINQPCSWIIDPESFLNVPLSNYNDRFISKWQTVVTLAEKKNKKKTAD